MYEICFLIIGGTLLLIPFVFFIADNIKRNNMKYKVGDMVLIKDKWWYINGAPITHRQSGYCGTVMTIENVKRSHYKMKEDDGWFDWEDSYIERKVEEWQEKDKVEDMSEPRYKIGDIVYLRFSDRPMKIIGRCYDEHWRYKIEGLEDNEYWYYEKDFKNME